MARDAEPACSLPQDDEARIAARPARYVLSRLLRSADDAQKGAICLIPTVLSGIPTRDASVGRLADATSLQPREDGDSFAAAVLPPDASRRSVTAISAPADARETVDDGLNPRADPWAAAPKRSQIVELRTLINFRNRSRVWAPFGIFVSRN
ncbi:hypothetical protein B0H13DRAFT_2307819 [Mycena leptocephala]|nr:hypothetical protein B0H13DRAFT_2307819 [Mycena leptocephala]